MSDTDPTTEKNQLKQTIAQSVPWADFLSIHPPDKPRNVDGMGHHMNPQGVHFILNTPEITLHCESDKCGGDRQFKCPATEQMAFNQWNCFFLTYTCENCHSTSKRYALGCFWKSGPCQQARTIIQKGCVPPEPLTESMMALKFGEWPPLGPVLPRKLMKLLQADRALFEQGRRAEGQGLGIGAFAYYRRVVENQRTQLFDKLIAAAERLSADATVIAGLKSDRDNWRFSDSVEKLKAALPDGLKLQGQSPLALLHSALSHNLHNESDESCLQAAQDIRLVLDYLAEQLDSVLKDRTELEKAVGRLSQT